MSLHKLTPIGAIFAVLLLGACETEEGPVEEAGEKVDETIEEAGEKVDETIEEAGDRVERATD